MKSEERKNVIVEAATKRFSVHGYHSTQISDIIDEADIARGTFYLYFEGKHDIFCFILEDFIRQMSSKVKSIDTKSSVNPATQMRENVERVVDAIIDRPEIGKIIFNEAVGLDDDVDGRLAKFYKNLLDIIAKAITNGIRLGLVRKVDPDIAACIVLGGVREVFVQAGVFNNIQIKRETVIESLISVLISGLGVEGFSDCHSRESGNPVVFTSFQ